jgi:hypothetical protein
MPVGLDVTVPLPVPALATVSNGVVSVKVAVTVLAVVIETVHVALVPVQPPPDQLVKVDPVAGVAVSTTLSLAANNAEQVVPQLMPAGAEVTLPVPVPALLMFRA